MGTLNSKTHVPVNAVQSFDFIRLVFKITIQVALPIFCADAFTYER